MSDAQIFQILSILYIAVGIGIVLNPGHYKKLFESFVENPSVLYIGGALALAVGYLIVAFHNTWTADVSVIVTIIGWAALLKGIVLLVQPKIMITLIKAILKEEKTLRIEGIAIIILGLVLSYLGFCPKSPV